MKLNIWIFIQTFKFLNFNTTGSDLIFKQIKIEIIVLALILDFQ